MLFKSFVVMTIHYIAIPFTVKVTHIIAFRVGKKGCHISQLLIS